MTPGSRLTPGLLAALGFLAAVGPFATDMYLASFTDIASDLGTTPSSVQLTLTAFLLGIGAGQLVLGPASDRFGRRPVLLWSLAAFALVSVVMVFSPHIAVLTALRVVQGFAGAAGVVVSRAIAVDLTDGAGAVRALSLIATVVGLGPLIAPPIGGVVGAVWGWRGVLAVLAVISVGMLVLAWVTVPESLPASQRAVGGFREMPRRFGILLAQRPFVTYVVVFSAAFGGMMAYISASPFVGQTVLGMGPVVYALGFSAGAAALIVANLVNARIAPRVGPPRMLLVGVGLALTAGVALVLLTVTGVLAPWSFILSAFALTAGSGLMMSNASALALLRAGEARGTGSALLGASQFLAGGIVSPLVGAWGEHTALPMAVIVLVAGTGALVAALVGRRLAP